MAIFNSYVKSPEGTQHVDPCPQEHTPLLSERKNLKVFKESATWDRRLGNYGSSHCCTPNKAGGC